MPGKVKVKILAGRNLPVMDRSSDTTDAYVEIKLGNTTFKTDVCRKSLNPQWNSEWYKFEMDDAELQDEPLQVRLMDHDTYSANDAIGKVYLNLNPLLLPPSPPGPDVGPLSNPISGGSTMSGWFPVYDTMHGIRGEVNIIVKVELFSDFNKFRQSSCGVQFFCSTGIPHGFEIIIIQGMVEELVVSDDPEYQWIDKIRTPRASNEARQLLFLKLSGEVQRKIGLKVLDLGGNAVLGYKQCFDLEGESGIVVRGLGTAVTLSKILAYSIPPPILSHSVLPNEDKSDSVCVAASSGFGNSTPPPTNVFPSYVRFPSSSFENNRRINSRSYDFSSKSSSHQHSKRKFKRSTRSLNDGIEIGDDVSLKSLFEQEDMRGEVTSGTRKFFRAISSFPRSKIKRFQLSKQKSCDSKFGGNRFQHKKPKHESVTVSLIKSIIESDALLDRVSESDETVDPYYEEPELRYVDGHLEPLEDSSSSSSGSSSEIEDISDISSLNIISHGSIKSKSDDESMLEIESISTGSKTSYPFPVRQDSYGSKSIESSELLCPETPYDTESSSETNTLLDQFIDRGSIHSSNRDRSPSFPKTIIHSRKGLRRSDTPPLSDMDLFVMKENKVVFKETIFSPGAAVKLIVTEPSFEKNDENNVEYPSDNKNIDYDSNKNDFKTPSLPKSSSDNGIQFQNSQKVVGMDLINPLVDDIIGTSGQRQFSDSPSMSTSCNFTKDKLESCDSRLLSELETSSPDSFVAKHGKMYDTNVNIDNAIVNNIPEENPFVFPKQVDVALISCSVDSVSTLTQTFCTSSNTPVFCVSSTINNVNNFSNAKIISDDLIVKNTNLSVEKHKADLINVPIDNKNNLDDSKCSTNLVPVPLLVKSHSDSGLIFNEPETCSVLTPEVPSSRLIHLDESQVAGTSLRTSSQTAGQSQPPIAVVKSSQSPAKLNPIPGMHRRSSDSDLSITPKGNSLTGSDRSSVAGGSRGGFHSTFPRSAMFKENLDMLEYPFITMSKFPPGFILHIGGVVTARSVKLLERMTNLAEPESRDSWWTDVRMEVRSHARALGCNVILNYSENTTICDDVCVLSACGTAAVISLRAESNLLSGTTFTEPTEQLATLPPQTKHPTVSTSVTTAAVSSSVGCEIDPKPLSTTPQPVTVQKHDIGGGGAVSGVGAIRSRNFGGRQRHSSESQDFGDLTTLPCSFCHIPYNHKTAPFHLNVYRCSVCRKKMVPDILLATIEPPEGIPLTGRGCFLQAFECRPKKDNRGELNAKEISDGLPFLEFEVHKQLLNKLHINGMNALFGLKVQICIGERTVAAHATGTGFLLTPLPLPPIPSVAPNNTWKGDARVAQVQQLLFDTVRKNREFYQLRPASSSAQEFLETNGRESGGDMGDGSDSEETDDELAELDPHADSKDSFVLVVDDVQDVDQIPHLIDPHPPDEFHIVTIESLPGVDDLEIVTNLQMFTQVWRSRLTTNQPPACVNKNFHRLLQGLYYKLRRMTPCAFGALRFKIDLPEQDELQISVVGMAVGLAESDRSICKKEGRRKPASTANEGDMIFTLEEDQCENGTSSNKLSVGSINSNQSSQVPPPSVGAASLNKATQQHSPLRPNRRSTHTPPKERYGVDLTPLSYVPGGRIEKYLGNFNFFFIRESTCIRESGGLSGFVHSFVNEVLAIVRAHVTALGGNAMVAYFMTDCVLLNNPHKNHGQCLVNVGGDAVFVSYFHED